VVDVLPVEERIKYLKFAEATMGRGPTSSGLVEMNQCGLQYTSAQKQHEDSLCTAIFIPN
jgi:hypothetical protein